MRVTVRLFARLRELAGRESWDLEVPAGATAADAWALIAADTPALAPFDRAISVAVNASFARMSRPLTEGDDVAFLPPVSGG
jgi:molybdopterin converting factor subunit 1